MAFKMALLSVGVAAITVLIAATLARQGGQADVETFVCAEYEHGIPYEQAAGFDNTVVPTLLTLLRDQSKRKCWGNAAYTLGVIGDGRAVTPLINLLERDVKGEVDSDMLNTLLLVPIAIGHIAAKGDEKAMSYLLAASKQATWQARGIPWYFGGMTGEQLQIPLAKAAILGLGISSQPQAVRALEQMQMAPDTPEACKTAVSESLKTASEIKAKGRSAVFGRHH